MLAEILEAREELESASTEEEVEALREANHRMFRISLRRFHLPFLSPAAYHSQSSQLPSRWPATVLHPRASIQVHHSVLLLRSIEST